jgi:glycosyltransferase involved in cell wall biosynthesis
VAEIAPRLHARGHGVDVYTSDLYREFPSMQRLDASVPREERTAWGAVHRLPVWSLPGELHYAFFRGLTAALRRDRPEIVHAHTYGTNQVAAAHRHRARFGTPFVLTAHFHPIWSIEGGWLRHRLRGFYDRRVASGVIRDASRVIVQTHEEERLLRSLGIPLPPLEIIPPGYRPLPPPAPGRPSFVEQFQIPGPYVLFVGRLASNKGLLDLAEAFATLARSDRSSQLVVVGEDGGQRAPLEARLQELGVSDRAHLLGYLPDEPALSAAYREARLTALPSEYEAFGLVLLESLAAGTPVVATRVGGIPEFVEDGRAGLLVPPHAPTALAEAIGRIWSDRDLARRLGEYGRDQVVPRYTWEALVDRLDALYREVVGR